MIQKENSIDYSSEIEISVIPNEITDNKFESTPYAILSYLQVKQIAKDTGLEFNLSEPKDNEFINLGRLYLMSLTDDRILNTNMINGKIYKSISNTTVPYLGYFQENMEFMIVNDNVYKELSKYGQSMYLYNYKLTEPRNFELSVKDIQSNPHCTGLVKINPDRNENLWINILFSVSFFVFLVFVFASGSILFMKLYNDAFDEKERYLVLNKIGIDKKVLIKAMASELKVAYLIPLLVMTISSYFSIQTIANVMKSKSLLQVNVLSVLVIYVFFIVCYFITKKIYQKNIGI